MAFSSGGGQGKPMADINTTPLVDVMLVFLIIFMITAPLMAHKVNFNVPIPSKEQKPEDKDKPEPITVHVVSMGGNLTQLQVQEGSNPGVPVSSMVDLMARLKTESKRKPQPEFNIKADETVPYQNVAEVLAAAKREGFEKISFNDLRQTPL
jgi:biopolymer transport protein ExbD